MEEELKQLKNFKKIHSINNQQIITLNKLKIFNYVVGDIFRSITGGALTGTFIQCFCLIDYLSEMIKLNEDESGEKIDKKSNNYKKFLKKYFKTYNSEYLYSIRCCLVHTYGVGDALEKAKLGGYQLQHKNPENHKVIERREGHENPKYWLNLSDFFFDVVKVTHNFFNEFVGKPEEELVTIAKRVTGTISVTKFDDVTRKPILSSLNYGNVHSALSAMDLKPINWGVVRNEIYRLCLTK